MQTFLTQHKATKAQVVYFTRHWLENHQIDARWHDFLGWLVVEQKLGLPPRLEIVLRDRQEGRRWSINVDLADLWKPLPQLETEWRVEREIEGDEFAFFLRNGGPADGTLWQH